MVPKMVSPEQKEIKVDMSRDLIDMTGEDDSFLGKSFGDETWGPLTTPSKKSPSEWKPKTSLRREKLRLDKSRGKMR
ncbi:hypothetical protein TNIN_464111 [Trichonephila inaurata madagascariensis]|uniref:Uncharacterized protein n=1 Tax=Trichonephila inaurata madagascariensis TaxID=2747483 RepID=A0A8X7CL87_9ARAC|nr:hypothetical protein TNIN_464111 [Trichonephila inaurata madagascariensis]